MTLKNQHLVHLNFTTEELALIDAWQEHFGIRTRSEAIRQMIRRAAGGQPAVSMGLQEAPGVPFLRAGAAKPAAPSDREMSQLVRKLVKEELEKILKKK